MAKSSLFAWALRASHPRPTTGIADALARSAAMDCVLAKNLMNSRRSMGFPRAKGHVGQVNNITFLDRELWRETLHDDECPLCAISRRAVILFKHVVAPTQQY
jgi:hypothetical protein